MTTQQAIDLAKNLTKLSKDFKSTEPASSAAVKRAFKESSKNDLVRTVAYLLEVVGVRDAQYNETVEENKDLKELLKIHNINLEEIANDTKAEANADGGTDGATSVGSTESVTREEAQVQDSSAQA